MFKQSIDKKNKQPRFKYIVEGANLFITDQARIILEDAGVTLFKDSSANKGGVTSSSLEVLSALSFDDNQYKLYMCLNDEGQNYNMPIQYENYVKEIIATIKFNASQEFQYIWEMKQRFPHKRYIEISNELSLNINQLFDIILNEKENNIFENKIVCKNIFEKAIPLTLQTLVGGVKNLMSILPLNYQKALISKYLAKQYFYTVKHESNVYNFYSFIKKNFEN